MNFLNIFIEIGTLFVVMLIGWICGRSNVITANGEDVISSIAIKIAFPALIVTSMMQTFTMELFRNSIALIILSGIIYGLIILALEIWRKLSKKSNSELGTLQLMIIFGNAAFMGFPVVNAVYGSIGVFYAASFNMFYNLLVFSYGVILLKRGNKFSVWKTLMNPGFLATILGFILFLFNVEPPYIILQPLKMIGNITIPLALLLVGSSLSRTKLTDLIRPRDIWMTSFARLLLFPAVLLFSLPLLGLNQYQVAIPVIIMATPVALTAGAFAGVYGGDSVLANKGVILSNLLSILTVPMVIWVLLKVIS